VCHDEGCLGEGEGGVETGGVAVAVLELTADGCGCAGCSVVGVHECCGVCG